MAFGEIIFLKSISKLRPAFSSLYEILDPTELLVLRVKNNIKIAVEIESNQVVLTHYFLSCVI